MYKYSQSNALPFLQYIVNAVFIVDLKYEQLLRHSIRISLIRV